MEIDDCVEFEDNHDVTEGLSASFPILSPPEPLQCRRSSCPTATTAVPTGEALVNLVFPLRAMLLMMHLVAPEKATSVNDIRDIIEKWETSFCCCSAPTDHEDSLIQQAEKIAEYRQPTKDTVIATVEAKMAMKSNKKWTLTSSRDGAKKMTSMCSNRSIPWVQVGCAATDAEDQGHIASTWTTPDPQKKTDGIKGIDSKGRTARVSRARARPIGTASAAGIGDTGRSQFRGRRWDEPERQFGTRRQKHWWGQTPSARAVWTHRGQITIDSGAAESVTHREGV